MEEIKTIMSESFYTHLLMPLSAFVTLIISTVHRKKFCELKIMPIYPFSSLLQCGIFYMWVLYDKEENWWVGRTSVSLFILIEFLIFLKYFNTIILIASLKRKIKIIAFIFMLYLVSMWLFTDSFYKNASNLFLPESLCILCFCFMYFFQIFKLPPELYLLNSPSFWVTTGCLFYFSCTIPLFFSYQLLDIWSDYYTLSSINYLAYSILFLFISKAFLCNPVQIK
jgi:hypothetical protein